MGHPIILVRERVGEHFLKHGSFYPPSKERILFLKRNLTEEQAFNHEIYMIAVFGRKDLGTGILHNKTNGGDGCSGKIMTEKDIENRRKARLGKPLSESHKRKIAEANRGTPKTMTEKRRQSDIEKGLRARGKLVGDKNPTKRPEVRKKISDSCKGRKPWNKGIQNSDIMGGKNPRARKLCYNGVVYDCIKDAVKMTGRSKYYIYKYSVFYEK